MKKMKKNEILMMLSLLKVAYPNFYKDVSQEGIEQTTILYQEMFKDFDTKLVLLAVKELINNFKYPPTIADIKEKIYQLTNVEDKSASELWECLLKAIRNGSYGSEQEFKNLPSIVKEYVRSPRQLQEMAQMDSDTIHSVVKGQFLKQIENLKQRRKEEMMIMSETKNYIQNKKIDEFLNLNQETRQIETKNQN